MRGFRAKLWIGGGVVAFIVFAAIFAPLLTHSHLILNGDLMDAELPPSHQFWFGTDAQGRDIFGRILYGARISLTIGIGSQLINTCIGTSLGVSAGFWGGWWDDVVSGLTNMMLAIPSLVFALALMTILSPGLTSLLVALGLTNWSYTCRVSRASTLSLRRQGYVQAAKVLGYSDIRIMFTQVLPNILGPILVIAMLGTGAVILIESALSFLGLGIAPPYPSWGGMLSDARDELALAPWMSVFPGLAIFVTVLSLNLLGDGLRDILDPQSLSKQS